MSRPGQYGYQYGYPPPPPRGSNIARGVVIGLAIACVIALVVAAVVVWTKLATDEQTGPTTAATTTNPATVVVDPEADAASKISAQSQTDSADVRAHYDNRWTAQISAKWPGVVADGRTWDNRSILAEYESMKVAYPNVRLLRSSDWPVFASPNWWIVVSAQSFASPDQALSWCRSQSLDKDHCFAKFISTTRGPDGSTRYQR